jgi:hypothetical protein
MGATTFSTHLIIGRTEVDHPDGYAGPTLLDFLVQRLYTIICVSSDSSLKTSGAVALLNLYLCALHYVLS